MITCRREARSVSASWVLLFLDRSILLFEASTPSVEKPKAHQSIPNEREGKKLEKEAEGPLDLVEEPEPSDCARGGGAVAEWWREKEGGKVGQKGKRLDWGFLVFTYHWA